MNLAVTALTITWIGAWFAHIMHHIIGVLLLYEPTKRHIWNVTFLPALLWNFSILCSKMHDQDVPLFM